MRRTNADKRNAIKTLLYDAEWSRWSDREIARRCGVDDKTVGKLRLEIEEKDSILRNFRSMERSFIHHKTGEVSIMKTERIGSNSIVPEARRTNADKRNAIKTLLYDAEWSRWSDREIARRCGVDKTIVNKLRHEIEENSILAFNASMERSFIHHKTGEVSIMKTECLKNYTH